MVDMAGESDYCSFTVYLWTEQDTNSISVRIFGVNYYHSDATVNM